MRRTASTSLRTGSGTSMTTQNSGARGHGVARAAVPDRDDDPSHQRLGPGEVERRATMGRAPG
jgi:hypothetical protein